jgi:hypothetical protein
MRGLSITETAKTAGAIYVIWALSALTMGWVFDRLLRAGAERTTLSKTLLATGCAGKIACITGIVLAPCCRLPICPVRTCC